MKTNAMIKRLILTNILRDRSISWEKCGGVKLCLLTKTFSLSEMVLSTCEQNASHHPVGL
jgi:hypothetical protein